MARIFEPIKIGKMEVKNRIVGAPTYCGYADEEGYVTKRLIDIYEERAKGGAGLITVEVSRISAEDRMMHRMLGIYSDRHIPGHSEIADVIHLAGAKSSLQIWLGGRQSNPQTTGVQPVAPSACVPSPGGAVPRALTTEECAKLADLYAIAAGRVKAAGYDAVMYHGTHGFLPQQFMSPYTNDRKDKYGDRLAFVIEMIQKTRAVVGNDFPIIFRMTGDEFLGERGITLQMAKEMARELVKAGADCIDVSAGVLETLENVTQPIYFPRGFLVHLAEGIREMVNVPVVAVGRINDPKFAEKIIEDERADMVALSRGLIADPYFPKKMQLGRYDDIRKCIACNACMDYIFPKGPVRCAVNPNFSREKDYQIRLAPKGKKVMVIGGGVGGMEAARVATLRGHKVTLYEKGEKLGGLVNIASSFPRLYTRELSNIVDWLTKQLRDLGVQIELGKEVTPAMIEEMKPEAVIVATGSSLEVPNIPGVEKPLVVLLDDYLKGEAKVGKKVAIVGAAQGAEVAVSLAREGKEVTLLESGGEEMIATAPYIDMIRKVVLLRYLQEEKVKIFTGVKIKNIGDKGITFMDKEGKEENLVVDNIIMGLGRKPNNQLSKALKDKGLDLYEIGDCVEPRRILHAIHEGSFVAREV